MGKAIVHLGMDLKVTWFETGSPSGPNVREPILYPHSFGTGPNILDPLSSRFRPKWKGTFEQNANETIQQVYRPTLIYFLQKCSNVECINNTNKHARRRCDQTQVCTESLDMSNSAIIEVHPITDFPYTYRSYKSYINNIEVIEVC